MKRETASRIATDLIEGGLNTHHILKLTAEARGVTVAEVREIKKTLLRGGPEMVLSYADAIDNGWEDERLGLTK